MKKLKGKDIIGKIRTIEQIDKFGNIKNLSYITYNKQKTQKMTKGQLQMKLQELKSYLWLETGNSNMLYGKREYMQDRFNEIIEGLDNMIDESPISED